MYSLRIDLKSKHQFLVIILLLLVKNLRNSIVTRTTTILTGRLLFFIGHLSLEGTVLRKIFSLQNRDVKMLVF